ncbi:hypothetical protein [Porphyromonas gingivalis]|uniref:hypothetical protein n=1 Tax=Porphyromonas gingivalis TaxID=837 RepID=UPI0015C37F1A|nr:hypothetical protein [Porphyromonas gingivalis]
MINPKNIGRSDAGYIYLNQSDQRKISLVGRKWVPIVYDRPTNQKPTSLQKKKADAIHFKNDKQYEHTTHQVNFHYGLSATARLYACTDKGN